LELSDSRYADPETHTGIGMECFRFYPLRAKSLLFPEGGLSLTSSGARWRIRRINTGISSISVKYLRSPLATYWTIPFHSTGLPGFAAGSTMMRMMNEWFVCRDMDYPDFRENAGDNSAILAPENEEAQFPDIPLPYPYVYQKALSAPSP
jgi:hypothetical protein